MKYSISEDSVSHLNIIALLYGVLPLDYAHIQIYHITEAS